MCQRQTLFLPLICKSYAALFHLEHVHDDNNVYAKLALNQLLSFIAVNCTCDSSIKVTSLRVTIMIASL